MLGNTAQREADQNTNQNMHILVPVGSIWLFCLCRRWGLNSRHWGTRAELSHRLVLHIMAGGGRGALGFCFLGLFTGCCFNTAGVPLLFYRVPDKWCVFVGFVVHAPPPPVFYRCSRAVCAYPFHKPSTGTTGFVLENGLLHNTGGKQRQHR